MNHQTTNWALGLDVFIPPTRTRTAHLHSCGRALTVNHIIKYCSALAELRERHRVEDNLKQDLGNEQLAAERNISFLKAARSFENVVLHLVCMSFDFC